MSFNIHLNWFPTIKKKVYDTCDLRATYQGYWILSDSCETAINTLWKDHEWKRV